MGGLFREEGPIPPINVFNFCVTIIYTQFHVVILRVVYHIHWSKSSGPSCSKLG